jgi:hypothetical protein
MRSKNPFTAVIVLVLLQSAFGQKPPDKIRGYKVYEANVRIENAASAGNAGQTGEADVWIKIGDPKFVKAGLTGVTFEIGARIGSTNQSGRVDFLTFRDFRINGIAIEIEEYDHTFSFKKDVPLDLPAPLGVFVSGTNAARAAYRELTASKKDLAVTGTVLVFGKFKKYGLSFKRVVPVKIDLSIKNPIE